MNKSTKYSTVIITDKYSNDTKVYSIKQKHIENIVLYKRIFLSSIAIIFFILTGLISYINYSHYQKEKLQGKITALENKLDSKKLNQMIHNLDQAEKSLEKIEKYLNEREVTTISTSFKTNKNIDNAGGIGGEYYSVSEINADLIQSRKNRVEDLLKKIQSIPVGLPHIGKLTSDFGVRSNPMGKGVEFHPGLDLSGAIGDPVQVTADGKIIYAGIKGGYGNCIIVQHGFGYKTLYGHLSKISTKKGQKVRAGQIIGKLGSTGRSTGPHVHYEIIRNKEKENPNKYLQTK